MDCGAPASTLIYQYDEDPLALRAILMSHFHVDHAADLPLLVQLIWLLNARRAAPARVPVYGPPGTAARLEWLKRFYLMLPGVYQPAKHDPVTGHDVAPGTCITLGQQTEVEFFATTHFPKASDRPDLRAANFDQPLVAYGMVVHCAGRRIVYSGDSGQVDDVAPYLGGTDLLVHELGHHKPADVLRLAKDHRVPHLLLMHLNPRYAGPDAESEIARLATTARFQGQLTVAQDGTRVEL
jgi:ribonuclease BN (tRNA processing enzyme)